MRRFFCGLCTVLFLLPCAWRPALAQNEGLDIVEEPLCFTIRNEAHYKVFGYFATESFTRPDGQVAAQQSGFRLDEAGAKDEKTGEATDRAEFCSYGPFFEGRKLKLVLRLLFPVFSCKTKLDQGEILIKGFAKPEGGVTTVATCFE